MLRFLTFNTEQSRTIVCVILHHARLYYDALFNFVHYAINIPVLTFTCMLKMQSHFSSGNHTVNILL